MIMHDWLDEYLLSKPGATKDYKVEWEWWRYQVGGKMFAATMQPGEQHREYAGLNLVSLKCDPVWSERLRAERCWISVDLDGAVPEDLLRELCDHSYSLVFAKLTKKLQREIAGL